MHRGCPRRLGTRETIRGSEWKKVDDTSVVHVLTLRNVLVMFWRNFKYLTLPHTLPPSKTVPRSEKKKDRKRNKKKLCRNFNCPYKVLGRRGVNFRGKGVGEVRCEYMQVGSKVALGPP